jgi:predicted Zn-ribbon and HTH transcriptional regulator
VRNLFGCEGAPLLEVKLMVRIVPLEHKSELRRTLDHSNKTWELKTEKMKRTRKPKTCSECGSRRIANILYGYPSFSDEERRDVELGKIVLGSCVVTDDDPVWSCADCGKSFRRTDVSLAPELGHV